MTVKELVDALMECEEKNPSVRDLKVVAQSNGLVVDYAIIETNGKIVVQLITMP